MKNLYGIVILYNPTNKIIKNIESYLPCLEKLYVMDNSPAMNEVLVNGIKNLSGKIVYKFLNKNSGIAYPINRVLDELNDDDWLMTMDQDSCFFDNTFKDYIDVIPSLDKSVYAICPKIMYENKVKEQANRLKEIDKCIQSGSIYNVKILHSVGGFDEKLFIDGVDYEICYRCKKLGYKLYRNYQGILLHHLGDKINNWRSKLIPISLTQHSALRRYYIVRNNLYLKDKYPDIKAWVYTYLVVGLMKIILVDDNRIKKLKAAWKGYKAYKGGIFGYVENIL